MRAFVDRAEQDQREHDQEGFTGPVGPFWTRRRRIATAVCIAIVPAGMAADQARGDAPAAHERAATACPPQHVAKCRRALARALRAVEWQRKARKHEAEAILERTRGRQPFAYAAKLAELACVSFTYAGNPRCRPPAEMLGVGRCESGLQTHDPNPSSTADGWMQFLTGTWASTPAGERGWSRFDVLAMAVATEARVLRDGGSWHEWSCGYAAS